MAFHQVQVSIPYFTAIPRDVITNTFHFESTLDNDVFADNIVARIDAFYTAVFALTNAAAQHVLWANASLRCYRLSDIPPRVPEERPLVITPGGTVGTETPTEVACVASFFSAPIGGVSNARLRNRVYIGGLAEGAILPGSASAFPMLGSSFIDDVIDGMDALYSANDGNAQWVTYSPTRGTGEPVVGGWVDNSLDTQRRRGVEASARTLFTP